MLYIKKLSRKRNYATVIVFFLVFIFHIFREKLQRVSYDFDYKTISEPFQHHSLISFTCVNSNMIFVIGGTSKRLPTSFLLANIGSLPCMSTYVDFANVRCGKCSITASKRTLKWPLTYNTADTGIVILDPKCKINRALIVQGCSV